MYSYDGICFPLSLSLFLFENTNYGNYSRSALRDARLSTRLAIYIGINNSNASIFSAFSDRALKSVKDNGTIDEGGSLR